ncbi:hypothetical protein B5F34_02700 [Mediterranea sp. An20]|nr:hypothetical protein B5F34_02700 [Mediterranea sp. An20]
MVKTLIRKTMQNGAKETDRQENAAERATSTIQRRKEKARRSKIALLRVNGISQVNGYAGL